MNELILEAIPVAYFFILPPLTSTGEWSLLHSFLALKVYYTILYYRSFRRAPYSSILGRNVVVVPSTDREKQVQEASSIHIDLGFSAPYLDLPLLRSGIPSKSLTPRIQWDFTPGESFTLPPLINTIGCSCEL